MVLPKNKFYLGYSKTDAPEINNDEKINFYFTVFSFSCFLRAGQCGYFWIR